MGQSLCHGGQYLRRREGRVSLRSRIKWQPALHMVKPTRANKVSGEIILHRFELPELIMAKVSLNSSPDLCFAGGFLLLVRKLCLLALVFLWVFAALFSQPAYSRAESGQALIVDVRSKAEWKAGHLQSAVWIPWRNIEQGVTRLGVGKDKSILLYCEQGVRADLAEQILNKAGYQQTRNLVSVKKAAEITGQSIVR